MSIASCFDNAAIPIKLFIRETPVRTYSIMEFIKKEKATKILLKRVLRYFSDEVILKKNSAAEVNVRIKME